MSPASSDVPRMLTDADGVPDVVRVELVLEVAHAGRALEVESDAVQALAQLVHALAVDVREREPRGLGAERDEVLLRLQHRVVERRLRGRERAARGERPGCGVRVSARGWRKEACVGTY